MESFYEFTKGVINETTVGPIEKVVIRGLAEVITDHMDFDKIKAAMTKYMKGNNIDKDADEILEAVQNHIDLAVMESLKAEKKD